jgi:hypothetical protein
MTARRYRIIMTQFTQPDGSALCVYRQDGAYYVGRLDPQTQHLTRVIDGQYWTYSTARRRLMQERAL